MAMLGTTPSPLFSTTRLGVVMDPEPHNPYESEGVLNPAAARAPDGQLYLFPRLVARGNYSRIGIARVLFDSAGDPKGVERMGIVLEPEADYELSENGGGCEEPASREHRRLDHSCGRFAVAAGAAVGRFFRSSG